MDFNEIPFSDIEAQLIIEVGTWRNFDEIEECLILDELLLLTEALNKKVKNEFRMLAAANGHEVPDDDDDFSTLDKGDSDLPPELLAAERELQEKKKTMREEKQRSGVTTDSGLGLGYEQVSDFVQSLDQNVI